MPKILRIINRFNLGGPTFNAAYLTKELEDEFETLLIGGVNESTETDSLHITQSLGLRPRLIHKMQRSIHLWHDYLAYREISKIIKEFKPDIVHTHASKAGLLGRLAAIRHGIPVIVHTYHGHVFHSYFGRLKTVIFKKIERFLASRSTSIVAISNLQKEELSDVHNICEKDKITVIPLGFDLDRFGYQSELRRKKFRDKYQMDNETVVVGIIGRLVPIKNHELFLHSIPLVTKGSTKKIRFVIIGDGESKQALQKEAEQLGISYSEGNEEDKTLIFTSWIRNIEEALPGLDIVCLTSLNEGTPVSLIEAQACAKAIVSTNVGGIADIVIEGKSALLCHTFDTQEFSERLIELIENNNLRDEMGRIGKNFVNERFQLHHLTSRMKTHYKQLLSKT